MTASIIRGTAGDDNLSGTSGDDNFLLFQGGNDTVNAGAGNDVFHMGAALNAGDKLDGGTGKDAVILNGNYSAGVVFNADTITNIEVIALVAGHSYNLTTNDGNVAAGQMLLVRGDTLGSGDTLTFDGSAELDGKFAIIGGAGDDTLTGGSRHDVFDLAQGGNDTARGGGGNDTFDMGAALTAADQIDGGTGVNTLVLEGDYSAGLTLAATTINAIETISVAGGFNYNLITNDANVASGATLTVDASALTGGHTLAFNGAAETDGNFLFKFGAGFVAADSLTGGVGNDTLELNGDLSGGVTLGATTIAKIEIIRFDDGHTYALTSNDGNVASGATLTVDASALTGSNHLFFNGAAESDGHFAFIGGAGADVLTGGKLSDTFDLSRSDGVNASGGNGNDTFTVTSAAKLADDFISGGLGSDTLVLNGDFHTHMQIGAGIASSIETLQLLGAANSYDLTITDGVTTSLTIDASTAASLTFNASGDAATSFAITGTASNDTITGGAKADIIIGGVGADLIAGGGGNDTFIYFSPGASNTSTGYDTLSDLTTSDSILIAGLVPQYFGTAIINIFFGTLDQELSAAMASTSAGQYAIVKLTAAGDPYNGHTFLVVDGNNTGGYQAGSDYVFDISNFTGDPSQIHFI